MMAAPHHTTASAGTVPAAAHAWDAAAEGWDRHAPMLGEWLRESTAALLDVAGVGPGARVLDVAAGAGDQTLDIARRVGPAGHVLATDISPRILALARAKLRLAGFDDVQTRVADAQALNFEDLAQGPADAGFDAVVCRLGLMLCQRPLAAMAGALNALRPGGRFGALVFSAPQANPCIAIMASTVRRHAGLAPASPFEPGTLLSLGQPGLMAELLASAGFAHIDVRAIAAPMRLPSVRHYTRFVQSAGLPIMAILAPLPHAVQRAAWEDIEQQLERFNVASEWVGPNEMLLCSATRLAPSAGGGYDNAEALC
jgi:ubiquinone/menaquinone biosynthesis C-methylase UbiE